jgi:hypothetical protein
MPRKPASGVHVVRKLVKAAKSRISAHWNEFAQNRWIFAISRNTGGFAYFLHKCGGFLELTLREGTDTNVLCISIGTFR